MAAIVLVLKSTPCFLILHLLAADNELTWTGYSFWTRTWLRLILFDLDLHLDSNSDWYWLKQYMSIQSVFKKDVVLSLDLFSH